jgi:outer membrane biogenesis lipoprotein LolB
MNTLARQLSATLVVFAIAVISGCASHPELRPYTAEETRQLQLEALQRRGLSLDNYEHQRRVILRADKLPVVTETADAERSTKG